MHSLSAAKLVQAVNDTAQYLQSDDDSDDDDIRYTMDLYDTDNEDETANSDDNINSNSDD